MWKPLFVLSIAATVVVAFPDLRKWSFSVKEKSCHFFSTHSALYANSSITVKISCNPSHETTSPSKINIGWVLRASPCFEEYLGSEISLPEYLKWYYYCPASMMGDFGYKTIKYLKTEEIELSCDEYINLTPLYQRATFIDETINSTTSSQCQPSQQYCESSSSDFNLYFTRKHDSIAQHTIKNGLTITVPEDNLYLFLVYIRSHNLKDRFNVTVDVNFQTKSGHFLSAVDYPLLSFYALMSCLYVFYAIAWLIVSMIQWKELLRIQFCIAIVILLGMLEKAIFYGVYQSLNSDGVLNRNIFYLAEIFSCLKRTLARILVIIVSCGFEIVKPHLGNTLNKIVSVGLLYFILGTLEATLRIYKPKNDPSNQTLVAGIPLALLDSTICWWIFSNLVQTTKILRLRRNLIKLELFNHFTNVLVFAVLASIVFMIWQIHIHKFTSCLTDWKNLWFDEAYWHILFSIILLAIMILWRPTNNNQRYAFTPLLDISDDEDEEKEKSIHRFNESSDVKIRSQRNSVSNDIELVEKTEETALSNETVNNLKWIEENISTTLIDTSLPNLIDSDEELLNTRFEISKMQ
ncbi:Transmembrane protein 87A [Blomia tropicalis]|nr:Transmembrane protein 87A [Blomia tropicalis]